MVLPAHAHRLSEIPRMQHAPGLSLASSVPACQWLAPDVRISRPSTITTPSLRGCPTKYIAYHSGMRRLDLSSCAISTHQDVLAYPYHQDLGVPAWRIGRPSPLASRYQDTPHHPFDREGVRSLPWAEEGDPRSRWESDARSGVFVNGVTVVCIGFENSARTSSPVFFFATSNHLLALLEYI